MPVTYLGTYPKEIAPAPQLLPDSFYRVGAGKQECLANIEAQAKIDSSMGRRMYEYGSRARLESGLQVFSVALWLFKDPQGHRPPRLPYKEYIGKKLITTWEFENIELYRLTPDAIIHTGIVELLPLVPFTQGATVEIIEDAMQRVKEEAAEEQVKPLAGLLGLFTSRFYGKELALDLFRRLFVYNTEIMQEFPLFRDLMAEAEAKGEARGIAEGEVKGLREAANLSLESRFGPLSAEVQTALSQAGEATLRDILSQIATESLEQVRARLGLNGAEHQA